MEIDPNYGNLNLSVECSMSKFAKCLPNIPFDKHMHKPIINSSIAKSMPRDINIIRGETKTFQWERTFAHTHTLTVTTKSIHFK